MLTICIWLLLNFKFKPELTPLSLKDLVDIYTEVFSVQEKWYNFGLVLKLLPNHLEANNPESTSVCLREMLNARLKLENKLTWSEITTALRSPIVKEDELAVRLERKMSAEGEPKKGFLQL